MGCFVVPVAQAIVTSAVTKAVKAKEKDRETPPEADNGEMEMEGKLPFSRKLQWLSNLLWGGSALLAFEHLWHGELSPYFPFLTAAADPAEAAVMLHEMATAGVAMSVVVTVVWAGMLLVSRAVEKKGQKARPAVKQGGRA
ncbi:MAG: hypothetical protein VB099_04970 [Candidatus Limiplasma sp.]|nr:hypothetical protein [Candidatus Limiplasma sp.]